MHTIIFDESKALRCIKIITYLKKNAPWNDSSKDELGTPGEQLQAKRRRPTAVRHSSDEEVTFVSWFRYLCFDPDKQTIFLSNIFVKRTSWPIPFFVDIVEITQIISHELSFRIILNYTIKKII